MATKAAMRKLAVTGGSGKLNRQSTILALLEAHGPMSDQDVKVNLLRIDPDLADPLKAATKKSLADPALNRAQLCLYGLRRKELAEKLDTGEWAAT